MRISKRNAKEIRDGILDARRGVERPWDHSLEKQGLYWEAHQRSVRKIVRLHEPMYIQERRLSMELELLDDRIFDLYAGDYKLLVDGVSDEAREHIRNYLDKWIEDFRDVREHYGLDYNERQ